MKLFQFAIDFFSFSPTGNRYSRGKNITTYLNEWVYNKRYTLQNKRLKEGSNDQF
jgi:hypothetical protein